MRAADHKAVRAQVLAKHADIRVENHGSLYLLVCVSDNALDWAREAVSSEAQWLGRGLAVEPRYVEDIVNGAREAGLIVGGEPTLEVR